MPLAHILNIPTKLIKDLAYNTDYVYDHESTDSFSGQNNSPDIMEHQNFYHPIEWGFEQEIIKRLAWREKLGKGPGHSP